MAVTAFHTLAWLERTDLTGEAYDREWRRLYVNMITEMRTDAFETTQLKKEWIEQNLPFDFPQVSEPASAEQEESPSRRAP